MTIAHQKYQGLQFAVRQAPDSCVTAEMLALGAKGGSLADKQVQSWIQDIEEGQYSIYVLSDNDQPLQNTGVM